MDIDSEVYGSIAEDGKIEFAPTAAPNKYNVVNEIACRAWRSGARVVAARAADIPDAGEIAAILRYPL